MQPRFACVADGPRLILSSLLLYLTVIDRFPAAEVIFGVPQDTEGAPDLALLRELPGAQIVSLPAPAIKRDDGKPYRIENKVNLLRAVGRSPVMLCDSDLLVVRRFPLEAFAGTEIAAKVADATSWNGDWRYVYAMFELPEPARRVITTTSKELSYPYFNSGFVFVRHPEFFGELWHRCLTIVCADRKVEDRFPYADQITLPIAAALMTLEITALDVAFNQSIHDRAALKYFVLHHHDHYKLMQQRLPQLVAHWTRTNKTFRMAFERLAERFDRG